MAAVHFLTSQEFPTQNEIISDDVGLPFQEKAGKVFYYAIQDLAIGTGLGIAIGWAGLNVVVLNMAAAGAVIGSVYGLYLVYQASCRLQKRITDFTRIAAQIHQYPTLRIFASVKKVLAQEPVRFQQTYHNHAFQHEVAEITNELKYRGNVQKQWRDFLSDLQGMPVKYSDGTEVKLDMALQIDRMEPEFRLETEIDRLTPQSITFERDLDELADLLVESFGQTFHLTKDACRQELLDPKHQCLIARQRVTGKILGLIWAKEEGPDLHILRVARRANTPKMGIGEQLFAKFFSQDFSRYRNVFLEVRESNKDAIALYEKKGFRAVSRKPSFYSYPAEDALVMQKA